MLVPELEATLGKPIRSVVADEELPAIET